MSKGQRRSLFVVSFVALYYLTPGRAALADERADQVARELIAALGGEGAWEKARQLRFDFLVEREGTRAAEFQHVWDRYTGDYRLMGRDKSGAPYAVYFNVNTRAGAAYVNGRAVEGEEKDKLLETAYGRFINDTYWLLAPWKVFDPGVSRDFSGTATYVVLGFVLGFPALYYVGGILVVVGVALVVLGSTGRAIGGRKHYF